MMSPWKKDSDNDKCISLNTNCTAVKGYFEEVKVTYISTQKVQEYLAGPEEPM
jgi:hypothetical protein